MHCSGILCRVEFVVRYRRFETTYRSHIRESSNLRPLKMGPIGCPETSVTLSVRCVTSQKRADFIYTMTET